MKALSSTIRAWLRRENIFTEDHLIYELMTGVFEKQPLASPGSAYKRVKNGNRALTLPPFCVFNIKEQVMVLLWSNPFQN